MYMCSLDLYPTTLINALTARTNTRVFLHPCPLLVGKAALPTVGEDPVDDGLPDAVEQALDVGGEHQRLIVLVRHCRHKSTTTSQR